jgi:predicted transcriptional regulator
MFLMPSEARTGLDYVSYVEKRNYIDIIADILAEAKKVTGKTRIMYNCNLSYKQLKLYINFLLEIGLLDSHFENRNNKLSSFRITSKGLKFLSAYSKLKALMG